MWALCGTSVRGAFLGELETSYTQSLKLSTVTAAGVNLFRTRQEIKNGNDAWFYTVFQLEGSAGIEQDDQRALLKAGDITLIDASRPCSIYWQERSARFRCCSRDKSLSNTRVFRK